MSPVLKQIMHGEAQAAAHRGFGASGKSRARYGRLRCSVPGATWVVLLTVSALLLLTPHTLLAAVAAPNEAYASGVPFPARTQLLVNWSGFAPTDWVQTLPFTSTVTAQSDTELQPLADAYQLSTDAGATWSAWSNAGLTISSPVSTTHQLSVDNLALPDAASLNYIRFRVTDSGGVEDVSPPYLLHVDTTPPSAPQNLAANPATWSNAGSFTVKWTNPPDIAGIAGAWYKLDSPPSSPSDGNFVLASKSIDGITPASDGAHNIFVWLEDSFGRADPKNAASTTLYWDTTAPEPPTRMSGAPARQWVNVNKFSESWRNPSDLSGIVGAYYKLDALPLSATDGTFVATNNTISDIRVPTEGRHDIYVWLVDGAGNLDSEALTGDPNVFWYDATAPISSMTVTPTLPSTGWYTNSLAVQFTATDSPVDAAYPPSISYQLDTANWSTAGGAFMISSEGSHKLQYQARDKAGNIEAIKSFTFGIDKTAPTVSLQADRAPNATGWYTAPVTYTLTVLDSVSGGPQGFYRLNDGPWQVGAIGAPTVFTLGAEGSYRIQYYGQDTARNRSVQASAEAHVDATPPTTSLATDGTQSENGWYISNVTLHLTPQDNGSGTVATYYRINGGSWQTGTQLTLSTDGLYDLAYYSTDLAGNQEQARTTQVRIDRGAPAAPISVTSAPAGWSRTNSFTVEWANPSDLSGITGAYVKLGDLSGGGAPTGPKDGVLFNQTQRIAGLTLPGEGSYRLYLWLRDAAGNADQRSAPANGPVLRFDATAPVTTVQAQGTRGLNGWWLSPVTVTLTTTDSASGIAALHYRIDGGAWQSTNKTTATLSVTTADKHVIEYYAEDVAGNYETSQQYTVSIDTSAPAAPAQVRVLPVGWTRYNNFHVEWTTVIDLSNIGGAYVKFDQPPANGKDGAFYPGATQINGISAPGEGKHSIYLWLRDGAGNADHSTAVAINDAVWYDSTPPTSVITPTAASGSNGWYLEPVTFDVSATDTASGLLEIHYQIDDGAVQSTAGTRLPQALIATARFVVASEGRHVVRIWAVDVAGNVESAHVYQVAIDQTQPSARLSGPNDLVTQPTFDVTWTGTDSPGGSGLASYDVQVRDGVSGPWQDWLVGTKLVAARFQGERGHQYTFRVYGRDAAGNRQEIPGTLAVLVQPVLNGNFDTGVFSDWTVGGQLVSSVVGTTGPGSVSTLAAKLGSDTVYSPSTEKPGNVPAGCAVMSQAIAVPGPDQVQRPRLRFWYRILTYDVLYSQRLQDYGDFLDVKLTDAEGRLVARLLRAGNPTDVYGKLYDTGWRFADYDLKPYAGWSGFLTFANCNGPERAPDNLFNTWSYVDSVQIVEGHFLHLPLLSQPNATSAAAAAEADPGIPDKDAGQQLEMTGQPDEIDLLR